MDKCHCPAATINRDAHSRFMEVAAQFRERYAASGYDAVDARHLSETLETWLADHICKIDVQLKDAMYGPTHS